MVLRLPMRSSKGISPALATVAMRRSCASYTVPLCGSCMRQGGSVMGKCLVQRLLKCDFSAINISSIYDRRSPMSTLNKLTIDLELGQTILVGRNAEPATITKIEYFEKSGEIKLNTTKGPRSALTFRIPQEH